MTEGPLNDQDEQLHRQVNPSWIDDGRVSSQAFMPMPKDDGKLSVDRASIDSPEESYTRFVDAGFSSCGVWAVTVGESATIDLKAYGDPDPDGRPNPAHAYIHFSDLSSNKAKKAAKKQAQALAARARDRGCLFAPIEDVPS